MIALWILAAIGALHSVLAVRSWWEGGPWTAFGCRTCQHQSGYMRLYVVFLVVAWWHQFAHPACRPEPGMPFLRLVGRALRSWWQHE